TPYVGVRTPNISLLLAVVLSTWFGGIGPGVLTTVLAALADWYFVLTPHVPDVEHTVAIALYLVQGFLVAYLIDALIRSRQRINTIVASISDGFVVFDLQWRIVYVNENGAGMAGLTREDLIGRSVWELFPETVGTIFWEKMHEAARDSRPIHF